MQVPKGKIGKPVKSGCGPAAVTLLRRYVGEPF